MFNRLAEQILETLRTHYAMLRDRTIYQPGADLARGCFQPYAQRAG